MRTKVIPGQKYYLKENAEVKRILHNARLTAHEDGYDQIVYEDEPGSVAYCRASLFGSWSYQTEDKIIAKVFIAFGND